ncbi:DNA-directed RNA polymerase subunit delta [Bacillus solimangrovi]|uniref:Probable DNA-directed RNA polymerase subunit delta n=1 Tax=Bacillus solimangrovi TaxID=1305675 RepID=A0A1E5LGV7_9BACI|nr:DNA-directed RNA polymerase subunit delta [Bacillus solimangrovi]OEH93286.1 DNA-directed RNA polymerase subunit delta [Bacillus solimangrovi]
MSLSQFSKDQLKQMSMIDVAYYLLDDERQVFDFYTLVKKVSAIKEMPEEETKERLAQFYTDINLDGRFINLGENLWGLRNWYPVEQMEEDAITPKKKKKSAKKIKPLVEDDDIYEDDEYEEDNDEEIDVEEDEDEDLIDDEDFEADDYDEDDLDLDDDDN